MYFWPIFYWEQGLHFQSILALIGFFSFKLIEKATPLLYCRTYVRFLLILQVVWFRHFFDLNKPAFLGTPAYIFHIFTFDHHNSMIPTDTTVNIGGGISTLAPVSVVQEIPAVLHVVITVVCFFRFRIFLIALKLGLRHYWRFYISERKFLNSYSTKRFLKI